MRTVVVTGGGRGIGRAIALALAEPGGHVVVTGRTVAQLDATAAELHARGAEATALPMDVADEASVAHAFGVLHGRIKHVDVLVNNAGVGGGEAVQGSDIARWKHTIDTNLTGMYLVTRQILPLMREGGRVINMSSVLGRFGVAKYTAYCASKHGVIGFTRALALELVKRQITVNALSPGWVETDMAAHGMTLGADGERALVRRVQGARDCRRANQAHDRSRRGGGAGPIPLQCRSQRDHRADLQHLRRANDGLNKVPGARCRGAKCAGANCAECAKARHERVHGDRRDRRRAPFASGGESRRPASAEATAVRRSLGEGGARAFQGASGGGRNPFAGEGNAVAAGQRLFDQTCQSCHGPGGRGDSGPALNTGSFRRRSDADLFRTIQDGVAGSQMPPFRQLSDNQLWQLVTYLRSLARRRPTLRRPARRRANARRTGDPGHSRQRRHVHAAGDGCERAASIFSTSRPSPTRAASDSHARSAGQSTSAPAPRCGRQLRSARERGCRTAQLVDVLGRLPRHPLLGADADRHDERAAASGRLGVSDAGRFGARKRRRS